MILPSQQRLPEKKGTAILRLLRQVRAPLAIIFHDSSLPNFPHSIPSYILYPLLSVCPSVPYPPPPGVHRHG
jgi:hypothetical protein